MMIDTNIIIDLKEAGSQWHAWSFDAVLRASLDAELVVSSIVVGELAGHAGAFPQVIAFLNDLHMQVTPLDAPAAFTAGEAHRVYRLAGGSRQSLLGDFLIGGHASSVGASLITRDARRYRTYFPDLPLITPETDHG